MTPLSCSLLLSCLLGISSWISQGNLEFVSNTETLPSRTFVGFLYPLSVNDTILFTSLFKPEFRVAFPSLICHQTQVLLVLLTHTAAQISAVPYSCSYPAVAILDPFLAYWSGVSTYLHDSHIASPSEHPSCCSQSDLPETASFCSHFSGNVPSSNIMVRPCGPGNNKFQTEGHLGQSDTLGGWGIWSQHWELLIYFY